jgi:hypothetical protein
VARGVAEVTGEGRRDAPHYVKPVIPAIHQLLAYRRRCSVVRAEAVALPDSKAEPMRPKCHVLSAPPSEHCDMRVICRTGGYPSGDPRSADCVARPVESSTSA